MKKNKRILFLIGSGAAHHWFDDYIYVTTKTITTKICCCDKLCCMLFHKLSESTDKPNFESIINAIENLYHYYFGKMDYTDFDNSIIFKPCNDIQKYFEGLTDREIVDKLASLYERSIEIVISEIETYDRLIKLKIKPENDKQFLKFLKFSKAESNIIRAYTLNYDQMFIDIDDNSEIKFYDGFNKKKETEYSGGSEITFNKFSTKEITKHVNLNCFYNLHGSIYWRKPSQKKDELYSIVKSNKVFDNNNWQFMNKATNVYTNPNERVRHAPIITGFKKLQRLNLEPFNAFWNSFYRDCHSADVFVFIGYSFGDPHINNALVNAQMTDKKVLIVDKDKTNTKLQSIVGKDFTDIIENGVNKNGNIRYCSEGITDFLQNEQYKSLENFF